MTTQSKQLQEIMEATARAFSDIEIEPQKLNALYDAAKKGRKIDSFYATGQYSYAENDKTETVNYLPAPVAANPIIALNEAGENFIRITLFYDRVNKSWRAKCYVEGDENVGLVTHANRDEALSRAIMQAVCFKKIEAEAANEK
ncbi:MAG: hypothetical protein DI626_01500 [Micavibrio aeruginosavorus]|uniref:Uncharacterized protein n=1 Tax=Micavibrio aeruginosavorus TaxID=349221 RepID=A0A2W5A226_9BACT|nr:MAG: hypothetical protein DI626_01500 [Micavibrio aeruginosavorus]